MDDLTEFRLTAPYRRTIDSPLARRLCSAAWAHRTDPVIDPSVDAQIRAAAIRAACTLASEDELDALGRFSALDWASSVSLRVTSDQGRVVVLRHVELGCDIRLPSCFVDRGALWLRTPDDPDGTPRTLRAELPFSVLAPLVDRVAAKARQEAEDHQITLVNRSAGRVTWRELLDRIPETREYVLALLAERDSAATARIAA